MRQHLDLGAVVAAMGQSRRRWAWGHLLVVRVAEQVLEEDRPAHRTHNAA